MAGNDLRRRVQSLLLVFGQCMQSVALGRRRELLYTILQAKKRAKSVTEIFRLGRLIKNLKVPYLEMSILSLCSSISNVFVNMLLLPATQL